MGQAPGGSEGGEGVTDVIQQLLELSEQVSGDSAQPQPPGPAIAMDAAINQDILQVSEDSRVSKIVSSKRRQKKQPFFLFSSVASSGEQWAECGPATG